MIKLNFDYKQLLGYFSTRKMELYIFLTYPIVCGIDE